MEGQRGHEVSITHESFFCKAGVLDGTWLL